MAFGVAWGGLVRNGEIPLPLGFVALSEADLNPADISPTQSERLGSAFPVLDGLPRFGCECSACISLCCGRARVCHRCRTIRFKGFGVPMGRSSEPKRAPVIPLTDILDDLDRLVAETRDRVVSLREVDEMMRGRGIGVLMLVLSIPFIIPVAIPLLATVFGIPMIVMGARIAMTGRGVVPAFALNRELSPEVMGAIAKGLRRVLRPIAFLFRPRLGVMFWSVPWRMTGVGIFLAALVLSLPIPVPFANMIPALGLIHFAAGLLQRDGAAICVGHAFTVGSYFYLFLIWDVAMTAMSALLS